jgi:hypothetical protein
MTRKSLGRFRFSRCQALLDTSACANALRLFPLELSTWAFRRYFEP